MRRVLIFHKCGHAEWHELPPMDRRFLKAVRDRLASMECPACWSGDSEDYASLRRPSEGGDGKKGERP